MNARYCNGQRGDNQLEDDTRRPFNNYELGIMSYEFAHNHNTSCVETRHALSTV